MQAIVWLPITILNAMSIYIKVNGRQSNEKIKLSFVQGLGSEIDSQMKQKGHFG